MFNFAFGGGGPFGGGGHSHGPRAPREVDNSKFYEILGVEKSANPSEIKKAFRKAAMTHHPDKGGDSEKFKEIQKAYEVLSNEEKRAIYDEHGEEGLEGGSGGGGGGMDLFDILSGGMGGGRGGARRQRKTEDVVFPLKVSLEDLYNGCNRKLRLTKNVLCKDCNGTGGKGQSTCKDCRGNGVRVVIRQFGPGMIQQMQVPCEPCGATGSIIPEKSRCKKCKGSKTSKEKKTLEVFVGKGQSNGQKIVFNGEADEAPDCVPGDVVVVLQEQPHPVFRREKLNLFMKKTITLVEALCGFEFLVDHLDGRKLHVKCDGKQTVKPGQFKCIREEGLPEYKGYGRGHLYIEFTVEFPKTLPDNVRQLLTKVLPVPPKLNLDEVKRKMEAQQKKVAMSEGDEGDDDDGSLPVGHGTIVEAVMEDVDMNAERSSSQSSSSAHRHEEYDEDDDHGPRGAGCPTQ